LRELSKNKQQLFVQVTSDKWLQKHRFLNNYLGIMCWVVSDNKHLIILEEGRMVVLEELGNLIPVSSS